jgi:microcystin-dependent protein
MAEPFIAQVDLFGFIYVPDHWAQCDGQVIAINTNQALFSLLGSAYGGDGRSTFALPDLRGRMAVSMGRYPGSLYDYDVGNTQGSETHTLNAQQMTRHFHLASFTASGGSGSASVTVAASTEEGDNATPSDNTFLGKATPPGGGADKPEKIYKDAPITGSTVHLGGIDVSGGGATEGSVSVNFTGSSQAFNLVQTSLILNCCIAMQGIFPSRN